MNEYLGGLIILFTLALIGSNDSKKNTSNNYKKKDTSQISSGSKQPQEVCHTIEANFSVEEFKFSTSIASTTKHTRQLAICNCIPGDTLVLHRERYNKHDKNTIAVYKGANQLGYINKDLAAILAYLIDSKRNITCNVSKVVGGGKNYYGLIVDIVTDRKFTLPTENTSLIPITVIEDLPSFGKFKFTTKVVGVTQDNRQSIVSSCKYGELLTLHRERYNRYDKNAIAVYKGNKQLGYIAKELAANLAPLIDQKQVVNCNVCKVLGGGSYNYGILINIGTEQKINVPTLTNNDYTTSLKPTYTRYNTLHNDNDDDNDDDANYYAYDPYDYECGDGDYVENSYDFYEKY